MDGRNSQIKPPFFFLSCTLLYANLYIGLCDILFMVKSVTQEFKTKVWNEWLYTELKTELAKVPTEIRQTATKDKDHFDVVLAHVCVRLCFNMKSKDVQTQFKKALRELN